MILDGALVSILSSKYGLNESARGSFRCTDAGERWERCPASAVPVEASVRQKELCLNRFELSFRPGFSPVTASPGKAENRFNGLRLLDSWENMVEQERVGDRPAGKPLKRFRNAHLPGHRAKARCEWKKNSLTNRANERRETIHHQAHAYASVRGSVPALITPVLGSITIAASEPSDHGPVTRSL